jgi:uncharacterized protein YecE (DUF72 family)
MLIKIDRPRFYLYYCRCCIKLYRKNWETAYRLGSQEQIEKIMNQNPPTTSQFNFHNLHPHLFIGTASDRYASWLGQIYTPEKYSGRITRRTKNLEKNSYIEEVLPIDSVKEYFEHFPVLEIDYTFYRLLLDEHGRPTNNYELLKNYKQYLKPDDRLILKVPQAIMAQKLRQGKNYIQNDNYLNPDIFIRQFYEPANEILGSNLQGFIFEQEYQRKQDRVPVELLSGELDSFFKAIPTDRRYHLEIRTPNYLEEPVFEILEKYGVGQIFSQWTWLPPLKKQFEKSDGRIFNAGKNCVIRLLTPIGMRYDETYAKAYPFDNLVDDLFKPVMVEETVNLVREILAQDALVYLIINNRAGGNAPMIAEKVGERLSVE